MAAPLNRLTSFFRELGKRRGAMVGLAVFLMLVAMAVLAPRIAPYSPNAQSMERILSAPNRHNLFGTDQYGRDIFSRVIWGARLSLRVGFVSVAIAACVGTLVGLLAGYYGSRVDAVIMALTDILLAFPSILLAMAIVAVLGPSLVNLMIAVGIGAIPTYARVVRASTLSAKELQYVEAARAMGCSNARVMIRHVLPNVVAPVIVLSTLGVAGAILTASGLSFIGLGAQPPTPEWGAMLAEGRTYIQDGWWITTFPGVAIMLAVLSVNMFGDGLRDALDPRLRTR
ncbi:MAG: ABC transporter permease [Thermomicrobiales bacterium]|nr:ABC transporter permease [Thermomicrobiales bacterium]